MAGKPITRSSRSVARTIDVLSKNTLADVILDRIMAEVGENAPDELVLSRLQAWLEPIQIARGDKPVNLLARYSTYDAAERRYQAGQRAFGTSPPETTP